jgi:translation initiation factor IF-3
LKLCRWGGRNKHFKSYRRCPLEKNLRCNEQIRISPIRLIDENDGQIGIVDVRDAMARAREAGLDLVEVAPQSRPPVCRIMDYGKWKYAQRKKEQKSKSHRKETELKEIRIKTPKIGDHDLEIKIQHAREFIERGDRVQFTLRFRGRELAHMDEGKRIFGHIKETLATLCRVDQDYRYEGKRITMTLAPIGSQPTLPAGKPFHKPAAAKPAAPRPVAASVPAPAPAAAPADAKEGSPS